METMKAIVLEEFNKPFVVKEVPVPEIKDDEVLIKINASGACGTDLKIAAGKISTITAPRILGHEAMGTIVKLGSKINNVNNLKVGDRVIVATYQTCGYCKYCISGNHTHCENISGRTGFELDGGHAEYMKCPATHAIKIPDNIPDDKAAVISCALATPYHGLKTRAKVTTGDTVLCLGVGGLGLHAVQTAVALGAKVYAADVKEEHLELAKKYGAVEAFRSDAPDFVEVCKKTMNGGPTVIFDTTANTKAFELGMKVIQPMGRYVVAGYYPGMAYPVDSFRLAMDEISVIGTRCINIEELREAVALVGEGKIDPIVTGTYKFEDVNEVYDLLKNGKITGRVVFKP